MEREAFARARRFLNFRPVAKWLAILSAIGTGVLYVGLLAVLGLFADLLVTRGRLPTFAELPLGRQNRILDEWSKVPPVEAFWHSLEAEDEPTRKAQVSQLSADEAALFELTAKKGAKFTPAPIEHLAMLPWEKIARSDRITLGQAYANSIGMQHIRFLERNGIEEDKAFELALTPPDKLGGREREVLWRAQLAESLERSVGSEAAQRVRLERVDPPRPTHGILGLVVRTEHRLFGPVLAWMARWNPWMWRYGDPDDLYVLRQPNAYYLAGLLLLAVTLALLRALIRFAMIVTATQTVIEATTRLRRAVYHHTFRLGTLAIRARGPTEAVGIFTRHIEALYEGLTAWLTVVFREPVKFALILVFALLVNPWLALACLLFALLVWLVGGQVAGYYRRQGRHAMQHAAEQLAYLQESLVLMRLVKVYLMELFNQSRVERQLARYARAQRLRAMGEAIYRPLLVFLGTLAAAVLTGAAGVVILNRQLQLANAITLATALVSLYWPLVNMLENRRVLKRARASAVSVFGFLDRPGEVGQVVDAEFLPPLSKHLEFDDVHLREPGTAHMLLQGVSLTIDAGQRVALVGSDEMEKHAIAYLITRFLDPSSGEIRIDNRNLRWVTLDSLRAQVGLVLQNNLVFNDTVANNIGCGDPSYTLPQVIEAAKIAHAHQFIQRLPQGYETPIGEMGHTLSLGEQHLIALARAVLRDPGLFIIEEPAGVLPDEIKAFLDDTYARVLPGRTCIFLAHRLSTIRFCDRIFLVNKGRVEASGNHRELISQNELYRHLHYLEFNELAEQVAS